MYLNLVYKSLKADADEERIKAFVKRLCQVLNVQEPPFIVGTLVLLGELFAAKRGLRAMLTEPEDESVEHFADVDDEAPRPPVVPDVPTTYDSRKRDPRFAHAGDTALWDLLPLLHHYHPTVSLNATQLLRGERVTSNADLTLNTLMHFLDRFVFRNPKKVSAVRGSSIMQPALSDAKDDALLRRTTVPLSYVNSPEFWSKKMENVPVDQQFFLRYFQTKMKRGGLSEKPKKTADEVMEDDEEREAGDSSSEDEEEKSIWEAMKASMPSHEEMEDLDEDDDVIDALNEDGEDGEEDAESDDDEGTDDEDAEAVDADDIEDADGDEVEDADADEIEGANELEGADADDDTRMFLEDEDDLVPFTNFDEPAAGQKRAADEDADDASKGKNKVRKEQRRKRRALPELASAEDYAHLLDSDDEGNM